MKQEYQERHLDSPIVSDKLYIVSVMTSLDTVDTDGVAICRVARPTPETQTRRFRHVKRLKNINDAALRKQSASFGDCIHFLENKCKKGRH